MATEAERDWTAPRPAMSSSRATSIALRAILASLLLLLQSLALAGVSAEAGAPFHAGAALSGDGANCDARGDHEAPARPLAHLHCCLLCASQDRAGFALLTTPDAGVLGLPTERIALAVGRASRTRAAHPVGWTSSWSSRAPPLAA